MTYASVFDIRSLDVNVFLAFYHPKLNFVILTVSYCRIAFLQPLGLWQKACHNILTSRLAVDIKLLIRTVNKLSLTLIAYQNYEGGFLL